MHSGGLDCQPGLGYLDGRALQDETGSSHFLPSPLESAYSVLTTIYCLIQDTDRSTTVTCGEEVDNKEYPSISQKL